METYTLLRQFADSWVMLAMFLSFIGIIIWAFWPGQAKARQDASMIPFRHEDGPVTGQKVAEPDVAGSKSKNRKGQINV